MEMKIEEHILQLSKKKKIHFSLLDPDKQEPKKAGNIAKIVTEAGSSAIMVGGSTIQSPRQVDDTIKAIKNNTNLPVILFPSSSQFLSKYADAIFFMSLLNSRNLDYVIREPVQGAKFVKQSGLEPLSMGYVIVEPGMTVGKVGAADLLGKNDVETAVGYALAAQYFGMKFFYLEAGSGATFPVSNKIIQGVKENTGLLLLVGGGIRDAQTAREKAEAGADIIITGTALENQKTLKETLADIIEAIQR